MLGSPIGHSLSPVLHRAAYAALGLDWQYDAHEVTAETLADFLAGLDSSWRGLSLTMPLKRAVIPLCDEVKSEARRVGAVNTVVFDPAGGRHGSNTDVAGLQRALVEVGVASVDAALVVGSGATARSAVAALARLGCRRLVVAARSPGPAARVVALAADLGVEAETVPLAELAGTSGDRSGGRLPTTLSVAVSTLPVTAQTEALAVAVSAAEVVCDVSYDPVSTPLLEAAEAARRVVVGGFEMLLHQAAGQVELMTGVPQAPLDAMRAAGLAALEGRRSRPGG